GRRRNHIAGGRPLTTKLLSLQVTPSAVSRPRSAQLPSGIDSWWFVALNRRNDFRDQPLRGADCLGVLEVPRADQPLVSRRRDLRHAGTFQSTRQDHWLIF